jgi:2-oxoisovalerate dehydrogenase E1 component
MKNIDMEILEENLIEEALLIRRVEESFLELFSQGKLNGTVHTCVGQEFSAVAFAGQLEEKDFIFSNHRCHGHYLAFTNDYQGLIAELMGKEIGVCGGVGSSQHLCNKNFYSNGIQGGIVPVAAGMALANKIKDDSAVGVVFIGDGTLGEGVVYETMNIVSKWELPLLIVLENNGYAQSTPQELTLEGDILNRAKAFGIKTYHDNTWDVNALLDSARNSISTVRDNRKPVFHLIDTYRLEPHSKGDDDRDRNEIEEYRSKDPIVLFEIKHPDIYKKVLDRVNQKISDAIKSSEAHKELPLSKYFVKVENNCKVGWTEIEEINSRQVELINQFFDEYLGKDPNMIFIGEDILSPYGGAFKVSKNLSEKYPSQVFSTPISEQAISGISNGLALSGVKPYLEIMFGDFILLALDQIINHASKFHHMYNKQVTCPVVIRTPMGGGRGYGPTHSQTLDKFIVGIDNVTTIALNTLLDPASIYREVHKEIHPVIVIENKLDYSRKIAQKKITNYRYEKSGHKYPIVRIRPTKSTPTITIVTYGGAVDIVLDSVEAIFYEFEIKPEMFILTQLHPLDIDAVAESVKSTGRLITVEEGSSFAGLGSEIISSMLEKRIGDFKAGRVASLSVPIPSSKNLEAEVLVSKQKVIDAIRRVL